MLHLYLLIMDRSCQNCHCLSNEDFKQVANLKNSGLIIYIHHDKSRQKKSYGDFSGNNIILHNTSDRVIKRFDYIVELCQYRTKCLRCKMLIQQVRNVIEEISSINKKEVIGVCDICKRSHHKNKCKRCEYIVQKFITNKAIEDEKREAKFKLWLSKVQQILISVLEGKVICKHNICLDFEYKSQLNRLLNSLNSPVSTRRPRIDTFPELFDLKETGFDISESGTFLDQIVSQFKCEENGENNDVELRSNSRSESGCICKHLLSNKNDDKTGTDNDKISKLGTSVEIVSSEIPSSEIQKQKMSPSETVTERTSTDQKSKLRELSKKTQNKKLKSNKANVSDNNIKKVTEKEMTDKKDAENKRTQKEKTGIHSDYRLMLELLKNREKEKKVLEKLEKSKMKQDLPAIKDLPELKPRKMLDESENLEINESESILQCKDGHLEVITEMIKGTKIVHLDTHYNDIAEGFQKLPLLFNIKTDVTAPANNKKHDSLPIPTSYRTNKNSEKEASVMKSGILRYELSNREFIEKGLTKLPSTKIMRRMNIYKMLPSSDNFDWFKCYKNQNILCYHTGERFAEINDTGGGKWFYKNGNVALEGYSTKESDTVKRYVLYSSGEEIGYGKKEPITILACFDHYGNGVVYDSYGNERLKYNQSEGIVIDKNIAAPSRWKWHTLNDPPVLQQVFFNTYDNIKKQEPLSPVSDYNSQANEAMIAIELDNFVREQAHKIMQKFKPFQIRIKVLKINKYFSLRIVDQANIYLLYRCDGISFKISMGMLLKSHEIIDTDIAEVSEVSTPYDKVPPKSLSLINIQNTLCNIRKHYGSSKKNTLRSCLM